MSIRKLPLVSCFHIKRFELSSTRNMSKKVDRYLQFPFSLDMAPYLSSSILRSRFGNRIFSFDGDELAGQEELSSEFELVAVITHTGKLNAGDHYVTYLRLSDQWYKCDDAWITQVNESIVRASQGYMMFYVQKMLFYKASERPFRPQFSLKEASIYQLNFSAPYLLLNSSIQVTLESKSPNQKVGIYYDQLQAYASYKGQQITLDTHIPAFYQAHQASNLISASLQGNSIPVASSIGYQVGRDQVAGNLVLALKVDGQLRWKVGTWVSLLSSSDTTLIG
ncbi:hypothetical protein Dimus_034316 [Dionaea muscipula]